MSDAIMISVSSRAPGSGLLNTYRPTTSTKVQTIRQKRNVAANPHTTFSMRWRGAADCPPAAGSPSPLLLQLETGRASCRERVGQYVYNSVVAGSVQKQKNCNENKLGGYPPPL